MARSQSDQTIRLNTFSGGVSTKPFTKRLPSEVSVLDNAMISLERNLEKRSNTMTQKTDGISLSTSDVFWHFIDRGDDNEEFLVAITDDGTITILDAESAVVLDTITPVDGFLSYLTTGTKPMSERLRLVTVLDGTFILNTEVEAKLNSGDSSGGRLTYMFADLSQPVRNRKTQIDSTTGETEDADYTQNVLNFSYLPFPPESGDSLAANGEEDVIGLGKVFYCREPYLNNPAGFYQTVSESYQPYYRPIQAESLGSTLDETTWPIILRSASASSWSLEYADWDPRRTGNDLSNPGPAALAATGNPRGAQASSNIEPLAVAAKSNTPQFLVDNRNNMALWPENSETNAVTGITTVTPNENLFTTGEVVIQEATDQEDSSNADTNGRNFQFEEPGVWITGHTLTRATHGLTTAGRDPQIVLNPENYETGEGYDAVCDIALGNPTVTTEKLITPWTMGDATTGRDFLDELRQAGPEATIGIRAKGTGGLYELWLYAPTWVGHAEPNNEGLVGVKAASGGTFDIIFTDYAAASEFNANEVKYISSDSNLDIEISTLTHDADRPEILSCVAASNVWYTDWADTTTGDDTINLSFTYLTTDTRTGIKLGDMSFWRNRLWFSTGNSIFSSQLDDLFNVWIADPDFLSDTDPIDILVSNGRVTEVRDLVPFSDFMFIQTGGDTQYELKGSQNFISPTTAVVEPTTFYGSYSKSEPFRMGSQLYWIDAGRLYLYSPKGGAETAQAVDMSKHCQGYLPSNFGSTVVASEIDTVFFVDADQPNHVYFYRGQWEMDKQLQSAFGRHTFDAGMEIEKLYVLNGCLYIVAKYGDRYTLECMRLELPASPEISATSLPLVDRAIMADTASVASFDSGTSTTTFTIPGYFPTADTLVVVDQTDEDYGVVREVTVTSASTTETIMTVPGEYSGTVCIGTKYSMICEMSRATIKDSNMSTIDGVLTLKELTVKHFNSGSYDVKVESRGRQRDVTTTEHDILPIGDYQLPIDSLPIEEVGELTTRIGGDADVTVISLLSDSVYRLNITNVELYGSFKGGNSTASF